MDYSTVSLIFFAVHIRQVLPSVTVALQLEHLISLPVPDESQFDLQSPQELSEALQQEAVHFFLKKLNNLLQKLIYLNQK